MQTAAKTIQNTKHKIVLYHRASPQEKRAISLINELFKNSTISENEKQLMLEFIRNHENPAPIECIAVE